MVTGRFMLDVKSARKIEKLLGDKRRFVEVRKQKRCVRDPLRGTVIQPFPSGRARVESRETHGQR